MSDITSNDKQMERFKKLLGPCDPKVDYEAREKLIGARIGLLIKHAFFGNLATRLKLVNADEWLPTLATDGRHFYYNSRFVNMLDQKELEFGFGHEVLHCVYDHFTRRDGRDPQLWNIAGDYCINYDLKKHNVGRLITTIEILYDEQYKDMSAEEVYEKLKKNAKRINIQKLVDKLLDDHLSENNCDGETGGGERKPKISDKERKEISDEFKEAVINAANNEPNAGNIPGNVKKMLKDLTEPQMDWRQLLNLSLTSTIKDDYTWMRPSRRGWHMDAIMPGMNPGEEINIAVAIDTSGSISEKMLRDFLGEVGGCMESFTAYKIHLFSFDTDIHNPEQFDSDNIKDIEEYELGGFGGTAFEPIVDYLKENEINPERLVVFTDGYPSDGWGDPDYVDTLWIIHGSNKIEAPFGTTAYYEEG